MAVYFHSEDIDFSPSQPHKLKAWVKQVIESEDHEAGNINFIFCSDQHLYNINNQYLKHEEFTDIITFDQSDEDRVIEGDIFISIDRIQDNAVKYADSFDQELSRVIIHGILHLLGYQDKTDVQKNEMRKREDKYLALLMS